MTSVPPPFVNWSRTVRSHPRRWVRPRSEEEIAEEVKAARARGGRLKVCGARHSWSEIAAGHDVQMDLSAMETVVEVDKEARRVTASAGCPLQLLLDVLADHGLAMPVVGSIAEQTLAGLTATGPHGSSLHVGNLGSLVRGMRLIDGRGELVELGEDDPRLLGASVHLGALGVLSELTFEVREAFQLIERRSVMPFEEGVERITDIARRHAFAKLWWLPHTEEVLVFTYEETERGGARDPFLWALDGWINRSLFPQVLRLGGRVPELIPSINRVVKKAYFGPSERIGRSDHMLGLAMPPVHRETELAFDVAHTEKVMRRIRAMIEEQRARLDFIVELRFVKGDARWMSPAYGRDTCQIFVGGALSPDTGRFFDSFIEEASLIPARPHWGKELSLRPEEVLSLYPRAEDFRALVRELDPGGVFRNPFLDAVLGS